MSDTLPCVQQFRHTYHDRRRHVSPFHFHFSVSSPLLRDLTQFGRPKGIFKAVCSGFTFASQITDEDKQRRGTNFLVDVREEPTSTKRFPFSTQFASLEDAAIECDFWKLVLRRKYFLEVPWSHESFEAYQEAARGRGQEPLKRLEDESQWTAELLDFIDVHRARLMEHRDIAKPDLDLDQWEKTAIQVGSVALRIWVNQVRCLQQALAELPDVSKVRALANSLNPVRKHKRFDEPPANSDFAGHFKALNRHLWELSNAVSICNMLLSDVDDKRREYESKLRALLAARPPAVRDTEGGAEFFQADVS